MMHRSLSACWFCVLLAFSVQAQPAEIPPSVFIQAYIDSLSKVHERIVSDRAISRVELTPANRLFLSALQDNAAIHTLMRTNSKGVLINEMIRGKGSVRAYRSLATQRWFSTVKEKLEPHFGAVTDRQDKTFLFWASPVIILSANGNRRFGGVVAVKIDLLECFKQVARISEYPFRVIAGGQPLYEHRWESGLDYDESTVEIPGLPSVTVFEIRHSPEPAPVITEEFGQLRYDSAGADSGRVVAPVRQNRHIIRGAWRTIGVVTLIWLVIAAIRRRVRWRSIVKQAFSQAPT